MDAAVAPVERLQPHEPVVIKVATSRNPFVLALGCYVIAFALTLVDHLMAETPWWLSYVGACLGLVGALIHSTFRNDRSRLVCVATMGVISALALASELWWMLWPALAATLAYMAVWAFARGRRGRWFTLISFVIIHLSTATYGLMQVVSQGSIWWSFVHGLATLVLGAGLIIWSGSSASKVRSCAALRIGRVAVLLALFLPYVVLLLMGMRDL